MLKVWVSRERYAQLLRVWSLCFNPIPPRAEVGYVGNRLQEALWREACHLVAEGKATPEQVDASVMYGFGLRYSVPGHCAFKKAFRLHFRIKRCRDAESVLPRGIAVPCCVVCVLDAFSPSTIAN